MIKRRLIETVQNDNRRGKQIVIQVSPIAERRISLERVPDKHDIIAGGVDASLYTGFLENQMGRPGSYARESGIREVLLFDVEKFSVHSQLNVIIYA